jgi:hypothetical protein
VNAETKLVPITPDTILAREMARFVGDPLGFVMYAYWLRYLVDERVVPGPTLNSVASFTDESRR